MIKIRLLHPLTITTITYGNLDFSKSTVTQKTTISHAYCEVLKFLATRQIHPKMFLDSDYDYGQYLKFVSMHAEVIGCKFNYDNITKYPEVWRGFKDVLNRDKLFSYFNEMYLFSDCVSLQYKGLDIGSKLFADWRKLIPIESVKEINRVTSKTLDKK